MTTKHLYTIYTTVMLSVAIISAACKAFEISLAVYLVWYGSSILWRRGIVNKQLSSINEKELKKIFNDLVKEYFAETGEYPTRILLVAEGDSQSSILKHKISQRVY